MDSVQRSFALSCTAEQRPVLAEAVMSSLICWFFSSPMVRYLLLDQAVPPIWRSRAAPRFRTGLTVRECGDDRSASPDLAQDAFERIVDADPSAVLLWEGVVGEHLLDRCFHQTRRRGSGAGRAASRSLG